jgi:predicted ferric reductase
LLIKILILVLGFLLPASFVVLEAGRANLQSVLALCAGASAYSLMALNLFLATRPLGVEKAVGGLDRLYQLHKYIGISLLPLILFHKFVGMDLDGQIVASGLAKTSVDIAKIAFLALLILLLASWMKRLPKMHRDLLPYHIWRYSHRMIGVVFLALTIHQLFVRVPFDANSITSSYLLAMATLGITSFVYTQFIAPFRPYRYVVTAIERHPSATVIDAAPLSRGLHNARAGSFAIVSFKAKGLGEPHPFTLSQIGPACEIQISVRPLGDYTRRVGEQVKVGDAMTVEAAYGEFDFRRGEVNQIWLAGGIGITPFLAFADTLDANETRRIHLIYCIRTQDEAIGLARLRAAEIRCPGFLLTLHISETDGRMNANRLVATNPFTISSAGLWFCGPAPMRHSILKELGESGNAPRSTHFEEFEFR